MRSNSLAAPSFDTGNRFVNDNRVTPRLRLVLRDEKPRLEKFLPKHHLRPSAKALQPQTAPRKITVVYDRSASGQTIYAYVNGNPISRLDPTGLCGLEPQAESFFCKSSPAARILASIQMGAELTAVRGFYLGFGGGELIDPFGGGIPGGALVGFFGGVVGAVGGMLTGPMLALFCAYIGAY